MIESNDLRNSVPRLLGSFPDKPMLLINIQERFCCFLCGSSPVASGLVDYESFDRLANRLDSGNFDFGRWGWIKFILGHVLNLHENSGCLAFVFKKSCGINEQ